MKQAVFTPFFCESIPELLEEGRLYVSIRFRTASHLCACGCGTKVVTPIKPPKWTLIYNGETVSLWPSIGRWQLPCRAHYIIRDNKVLWRRGYSDEEIKKVLAQDAIDLSDYYQARQELSAAEEVENNYRSENS